MPIVVRFRSAIHHGEPHASTLVDKKGACIVQSLMDQLISFLLRFIMRMYSPRYLPNDSVIAYTLLTVRALLIHFVRKSIDYDPGQEEKTLSVPIVLILRHHLDEY